METRSFAWRSGMDVSIICLCVARFVCGHVNIVKGGGFSQSYPRRVKLSRGLWGVSNCIIGLQELTVSWADLCGLNNQTSLSCSTFKNTSPNLSKFDPHGYDWLGLGWTMSITDSWSILSLLQLLLLVAVLRHAVVLVLWDVQQVDVAVLVLQQLGQLLKLISIEL